MEVRILKAGIAAFVNAAATSRSVVSLALSLENRSRKDSLPFHLWRVESPSSLHSSTRVLTSPYLDRKRTVHNLAMISIGCM